jgi:hypothetical protein
MPSKLKFGCIGAAHNAFREELDLTPFDAAQIKELDGLLIVGPDALVDKEVLGSALAAGLKVAVSEASADVMATLAEITGIAPLGASALQIYTPQPGSSFGVTMAVSGGTSFSDQPETALSSAPIDRGMAAALFTAAPEALPELGVNGIDNFVPSGAGVAWGNKTFVYPLNGAVASPGDCDRHIKDEKRTTPQAFSGRVQLEFNCYWVDGEKTPYFIVIAKQTVDFDPAVSGHVKPQNTWAWDGNSLGYILYALDYEPAGLTATGDAKITLDTWSPRSDFQNGQALDFSRTMALRRRDQGGARSDIFAFPAVSEAVNVFDKWGCKPVIDTVGQKASWRFHEVQAWNPIANPPDEFGRWWNEIYKYHPDQDGLIRTDWPEQSRKRLHTVAISAWRVDCASKPGPQGAPIPENSVTVKYKGSVQARYGFFHNTNGCNRGRHHLFPRSFGVTFDLDLNLDKLCKPL